MKKGESFQLKYTWWDTGRPGAMKSTGLGTALKAYEKSKADALPALKALLEVEAARQRAIGMCTGALFPDTKAALQKTAAITQATQSQLLRVDKQIARVTQATTDINKGLKGVPAQVTQYNNASDTKTRNELATKIGVNVQYLADAVTRGSTASDELGRYEVTLKQYPGVWAKVSAAKGNFDHVAQDARKLVKQTSNFRRG
jgi:hypothetical protein